MKFLNQSIPAGKEVTIPDGWYPYNKVTSLDEKGTIHILLCDQETIKKENPGN